LYFKKEKSILIVNYQDVRLIVDVVGISSLEKIKLDIPYYAYGQ